MNLRFARTTDTTEAYTYWLNRRGDGILNAAKWASIIHSRSIAKRGRIVALEQRMKYSRSMMTAKHPNGMKPAWSHIDDRTKSYFAKWHSHKERVAYQRSQGK